MRTRYGTRRPRRARRRRPLRAGVKKAVRTFKRKVFAKRVRKIVQRSAETKHVSKRGTKYCVRMQNAQTSLNTNMWILSPSTGADNTTYGGVDVAKGTSDGQRVGNKITLKKAMFNISMYPTPYNAATNVNPTPQVVRMYFFRTKINKNTVPASTTLNGPGGNFFQDGTTATGFIGTLADINMRLNDDLYTYVGSKTVKLGYASNNGTGAGSQPGPQYFQNNDFRMNYTKRMNITKYLPKQFLWDDAGNVVTPYTYCLIQPLNADGSNNASLVESPINCIYEQYYEYTDV